MSNKEKSAKKEVQEAALKTEEMVKRMKEKSIFKQS